MLSIYVDVASGEGLIQILAHLFNVETNIQSLNVVVLIKPFMGSSDGMYAKGGFLELLGELWIIVLAGLQPKHGRDNRQAVFDPVIHFSRELCAGRALL